MNYLKAFEVRYLGATNHLGSRVKITDTHTGHSRIIAYDYAYNNCWEMAMAWLVEHDCLIVCRASNQKVSWLLTDNFEFEIQAA